MKIPFLKIFQKPKSFLGIDVGTSSIKIVEISYGGREKPALVNYGEKKNEIKREDLYRNIRKKTFAVPHREVAESIKSILKETKISKREAVFSIPDFMSFFTVFRTPPMPKEEVASVVQFEARQHIPLPLEEVALDWSIIDGEKGTEKSGPKILLVAVPKKIISEYERVAKLAGVSLLAIEAEVFSLARASVKEGDLGKTVQLIDVGVQSSTISIIQDGLVKATYSIDFSGGEMTKRLADSLKMDYNEAERVKLKEGIIGNQKTAENLRAQIDGLISESRRVSDNFFRMEKKEIDKIILAGGAVMIPGVVDYFGKTTGKKSEIVDPFSDISYPEILKERIKELGPKYAIAVGLALRNREF